MSTPALNLHDASGALQFYEGRFERGYMSRWPEAKRTRVSRLVQSLGLPPQGRALDFGCGAGVFTDVLARALPGWQIDGTDLSVTAIEQAKRRLPSVSFFPLSACEQIEGQYDFVFTHHVLEHVSDIQQSGELLRRMLKPRASMLHILPCGNAGSFAHWVCTLRRDGIDPEQEFRFFYDEEGHMRRLDSRRLGDLWKAAGFRQTHAWYAHQRTGTIAWITGANLEDVIAFADPRAGYATRARHQLAALRIGLLALWVMRKPMTIIRHKTTLGCRTARDYALLFGAIGCAPLSFPIDRLMPYLEEREWHRRQDDPRAAEMYVHLSRDCADAPDVVPRRDAERPCAGFRQNAK
ncbi:MAG: class I SAM-dependent methyltransferase [Vicinamibacterales bacterium]